MDVLEVIKALHQAASDAYDGGEEWGGKREVDDWIKDPRLMDGFRIKINADVLEVGYHAELSSEELRSEGLNEDIQDKIDQAVSYLKRKFKSQTGSALKLTEMDTQPDSRIESSSIVKTWVIARRRYTIGNYDCPVGETKNILEEARDEFRKEPPWKKMLRAGLEDGKEARLRAHNSYPFPGWQKGLPEED